MIKLRSLILVWTPLSLLLGFGFTQIPWGDPEGFHGTGVPFASVYWDYVDGATQPIDYPNPIAPLLNAAAFFIIGSIAIGSVWWISSLLRERRLRTHV